MPIRPEMRGAYSPQWPQIRASIRERARNRCERCGVPNYAAGHRDAEGRFWPTSGNLVHDAAGAGELSYAEARELVDHANECCGGLGADGERGIVIVLTCAHLNHDVTDNRLEGIQALCQMCHNRHDAKMRASGIKARRGTATGQLLLEDA